MPIKIPDGLPAGQSLLEENIFAMYHQRALSQDIRPLRIGILNLMPAKEATELQFLRLLSNTALQVDVTLIRTASYTPSHTESAHLESFYRTFDEIRDEPFDGLIVTGAPVERLDFKDVLYWDELTAIMDWADANVYSTFYVCWAAQAALYHFYGIDKQPLPEKLFGVYPHRVCDRRHKLTRGFDDIFFIPHSRHSATRVADIEAEPSLELAAVSDEAGLYLCADKNGRRVFATGHGEYDGDTLLKEYNRDKAKGLDIKPPKNLFPDDDVTQAPLVSWRAHGSLLISNWLNYYVYQETPYDISLIPGA